jgi:hypothetical protein
VPTARRPLVWRDSLDLREAGESAWLGPDASLASADVQHLGTHGARARSVFRAENGDFGVNRYSLMFERGDSTRWFRIESGEGSHDPAGALGREGDHAWGVSTGWARGPHQVQFGFLQRGAAQELAHAAVSEDASAQSGRLGYTWERHGRRIAIALERGLDARSDVIDAIGYLYSYSRRDAQENRATLEAGMPWAGGTLQARSMLSKAWVRRTFDDAFDRRNTTTWTALAWRRPAGDGSLRLELGAGRPSSPSSWQFAPSASYEFAGTATRGRVFAGALTLPVWSDLAPGQAAFLQRTTVTGLSVEARTPRVRASASVMAGETRDRAIVFPYPLMDIWLRAGATAETRRYDFALLTAAAEAGSGHLYGGVSGFALARDQDPSEPRVEPGEGARGWVEARFSLFQHDLGIRLRAERAGVGARESKTGGIEETLPEFWTSAVSATMTLASLTLILRSQNLENGHQPQPWIDPGTGSLALGPGRQFSFSMSWRMMN